MTKLVSAIVQKLDIQELAPFNLRDRIGGGEAKLNVEIAEQEPDGHDFGAAANRHSNSPAGSEPTVSMGIQAAGVDPLAPVAEGDSA